MEESEKKTSVSDTGETNTSARHIEPLSLDEIMEITSEIRF